MFRMRFFFFRGFNLSVLRSGSGRVGAEMGYSERVSRVVCDFGVSSVVSF